MVLEEKFVKISIAYFKDAVPERSESDQIRIFRFFPVYKIRMRRKKLNFRVVPNIRLARYLVSGFMCQISGTTLKFYFFILILIFYIRGEISISVFGQIRPKNIGKKNKFYKKIYFLDEPFIAEMRCIIQKY